MDKWFWVFLSLLLYTGICFIGGLKITVGLGIFFGGAVAWAIIINEFLEVSNKRKIEYLKMFTLIKPNTFKAFTPLLKKLEEKEK
ncbi:MAG: hypothetical protein PWQ96_1443 [Clostridia bacterium]|jgi:hypothetical protein|nr:hypothetical protein [Clostridiales bacterium]MDK2985801.1 hypothetical protein [Clostridia bacterium]